MAEKLAFLTGHLAEDRLRETVRKAGLDGDAGVVLNLGVKVAALLSQAIIVNRLRLPDGVDRVVLPGRCRVDLDVLSQRFNIPFVRGPDEIFDLPTFLGRGGVAPDLSKHDMRIFAEIVEAPDLSVGKIVSRARELDDAGADVIDLGCLPDVAFDHLEDAVRALKEKGLQVSVDSGDVDELRRGVDAGADFVFSLDENTLDIVAGTKCVPILVPQPHGDLDSLLRAIDKANDLGIAHIADPILDPIHFGLTASLERYAALRRARPDVEILMGTGNLTELTDADSQGVTAVLLGICSELEIRNALVVQVSPHTLRTVQEHDAARRLMFRSREDGALPKGYGGGLLSLHDLAPFAHTSAEVKELAGGVRDTNFRIQVTEEGVHIYNRDGHFFSNDPFDLFPHLGVEKDGSHAFYLGYELAKAEVAWQLKKRYAQDGPLKWGVAAEERSEDLTRHASVGATLKSKTKGDPAKRKKADRQEDATDGDHHRDYRNDSK